MEKGLIWERDQRLHHCAKYWLLLTLIVGSTSLVLSLSAVVLAASAYMQAISANGNPQQGVIVVDSEAHEWMMKDMEDTHFQGMYSKDTVQRSLLDPQTSARYGNVCRSDISLNTTGEKPSAHIVAPVMSFLGLCPVPKPPLHGRYSMLSKDWLCGYSTDRNRRLKPGLGHVRGGMAFNRTSGFLYLPVDGTYFIYSQVQFHSNSSEPILMGHRTVVCLPPPHGRCSVPDAVHSGANVYMETITEPYVEANTVAQFHGGIFHFPAGTQVGVWGYWPFGTGSALGSEEALFELKASWYHTFMGAYLIDEVPFE